MNEIIAPSDLDAIATEINAEHEAAKVAFNSGFTHAVRAGELLIKAKAEVKHGEWLPWLEENCQISLRSAQLYMRLTNERSRIESNTQDLAYLTLEGAAALLGRPKEKKVESKETTLKWWEREEAKDRLKGKGGKVTVQDLQEQLAAKKRAGETLKSRNTELVEKVTKLRDHVDTLERELDHAQSDAGRVPQGIDNAEDGKVVALPSTSRRQSRPARWQDAASRACEALEELEELRSEYEDWQQGLPETLETGPVAEKLEEVVDIDFAGALEVAQQALDADLPLGFGRD